MRTSHHVERPKRPGQHCHAFKDKTTSISIWEHEGKLDRTAGNQKLVKQVGYMLQDPEPVQKSANMHQRVLPSYNRLCWKNVVNTFVTLHCKAQESQRQSKLF